MRFKSTNRKLVRDRRSQSRGGEKEKVPEFITKPRRQFIEEGQTAKFKATIDGSPTTKLFWSKNGKVITNDSKHRVSKGQGRIFQGHLEVILLNTTKGGHLL